MNSINKKRHNTTLILVSIGFILTSVAIILQHFGIDLFEVLGLHSFISSKFHFYQIITHTFLIDYSFVQLPIHLLLFYFFVLPLENSLGSRKLIFLLFFLTIIADTSFLITQAIEDYSFMQKYTTVHLSGSIVTSQVYLSNRGHIMIGNMIWLSIMVSIISLNPNLIVIIRIPKIRVKLIYLGIAFILYFVTLIVILFLRNSYSLSQMIGTFVSSISAFIISCFWRKNGRIYTKTRWF